MELFPIKLLTEILFAISILILGTLLTLEDLRFGIFLFILFIPLLNKAQFSLIIWDLLPIRIITVSLALVSILRFYQWWKDPDFKLKIKKEKAKIFLKDKFLIILIALWVIRLISFIRSENLRQSFLLLGFYTSIIFLYGFLKYIYSKYKRAVFFQNISFYQILGVVASLYALIQVYLVYRSVILPGVWAIPGHVPRVGSTFWDVNHFAAFLQSLIPISFGSFLLAGNGEKKISSILLIVLFLIVFFLTGSRSAWLGFGFSVFTFLILLIRKNYKVLSFYILSISVVIFITIPTYNYLRGGSPTQFIKNFIDYRSESFGAHIWLLQGAWEIFTKNPVIGGGYGNFDENFRKTEIWKHYKIRDSLPSDVRIPSHSIWGEVLSETGIVGFSLYFLLMSYVIYSLMRAIKITKNRKDLVFSVAFLSSIVGLLTAGIFYTYNLEFFWLIIFWGVLHAKRTIGA